MPPLDAPSYLKKLFGPAHKFRTGNLSRIRRLFNSKAALESYKDLERVNVDSVSIFSLGRAARGFSGVLILLVIKNILGLG